jgi:hypothetical protein
MNCSYCGNKVDDITKGCPTCGNYANSSINYCHACGKENLDGYNICAGCKTPLIAKQNEFVAWLLSFFITFPFLAFYAGRKKEALIRTGILIFTVILTQIMVSFNEKEISYLVFGYVIFFCWGFLFIWSCLDIIRLMLKWPKPYTNGDGLIM